jgi:alginate O-acetyltransferase complex protein AlgI
LLFNSAEFLIFFPVVVGLFLLCPRSRQWLLLLAASYVFYGSWRLSYLALILATTVTTHLAARGIAATSEGRIRRAYLVGAIGFNLGLLVVFKYFNFLATGAGELSGLLGMSQSFAPPLLDVALPVGISFYTFQALGHAVDVYRGDTPHEKRLGRFALFVAFFPQLVAGPIERSSRLLPQLDRFPAFDYDRVRAGLQLMAWGLFKKVVIADRLAAYVSGVYGEAAVADSAQLALATYFFAFQILCDFSGYTDIAIGAAQVLGVELTQNFRQPYFSRSAPEFWRRWHVTLSSWFRDYLYVPLGGNRVNRARWIVNIAVVFFLSGLWHGAAWTFVLWGLWHGALVIGSVLTAGWRERTARAVGLLARPRLRAVWQGVATFHLVVLGWVFFRAESVGDAGMILRKLVAWEYGGNLLGGYIGRLDLALSLGLIALLVGIEALQRRMRLRQWVTARPFAVRWAIYLTGAAAILVLGVFEKVEFIYFQF